jgi:quinol monooxygenase YgiN
MSLRLILRMQAKPGRGPELLKLMEERGTGVRKEPGCEHFEIFQSGHDPDHLCLLELWTDQAHLDSHATANATRPVNAAMVEVRAEGPMLREDYEYGCVTIIPSSSLASNAQSGSAARSG